MKILIAVGLACIPVYAQARSWTSLQRLPQGTELRVESPRSHTVSGRLESVTDSALVLSSQKGQQMFSLPEIMRVSVRGKKGHRVRNTVLGFGIGAGAGLAIGAVADSGRHCTGGIFGCIGPYIPAKAVYTPFGALVGVIVGVLIPSGGWSEIYNNKP